jgi:hypothetical protein
MKDSVPLDAPEAVRAEADGHTLYIKNSRQEHSGNYTCVAQNHAGNISKSFQLDVLGNTALHYMVHLSLQFFISEEV